MYVTGYKFILECLKDGKFFRTVEHLREHQKRKHGRESEYKKVLIDGNYIKHRMGSCHTERLEFGHKYTDGTCDKRHSFLNSCSIRICEKCEPSRKNQIKKRFYKTLCNFRTYRLLTLTVKGYHTLDRKKEIEYAFKKFQQMLGYRYIKLSFVRVLELVPHDNNTFYFHYHLIVDRFIFKETVSRLWKKATGDSFIVDIELIKGNVESAVSYVTKYMTKQCYFLMGNTDKYETYSQLFYGKQFSTTRLDSSFINRRFIPLSFSCSECGQPFYFLSSENVAKNDYQDTNLSQLIEDL